VKKSPGFDRNRASGLVGVAWIFLLPVFAISEPQVPCFLTESVPADLPVHYSLLASSVVPPTNGSTAPTTIHDSTEWLAVRDLKAGFFEYFQQQALAKNCILPNFDREKDFKLFLSAPDPTTTADTKANVQFSPSPTVSIPSTLKADTHVRFHFSKGEVIGPGLGDDESTGGRSPAKSTVPIESATTLDQVFQQDQRALNSLLQLWNAIEIVNVPRIEVMPQPESQTNQTIEPNVTFSNEQSVTRPSSTATPASENAAGNIYCYRVFPLTLVPKRIFEVVKGLNWEKTTDSRDLATRRARLERQAVNFRDFNQTPDCNGDYSQLQFQSLQRLMAGDRIDGLPTLNQDLRNFWSDVKGRIRQLSDFEFQEARKHGSEK
jgi:hypothetical protein